MKIYLFMALFVASTSANALSRHCKRDLQDPYDPGLVMPFGPDQGACLEATEVRASDLVQKTRETTTLSNFRHARQFWLATIPTDGVERVFFQIAAFKEAFNTNFFGIAHAQIRFLMRQDHPVLLHDQHIGQPYRAFALNDFVVTGEAFHSVNGDPYPERLFGGAGFVRQFISLAERVTYEVLEAADQRVMQLELKLNDEQRAHLLATAIDDAVQWGYRDRFNVLTNNCVKVMIDILDKAFPGPKHHNNGLVTFLDILQLNAVIRPTQNALLERRLIIPNDITLLGDETSFGQTVIQSMLLALDGSSDPALQAESQHLRAMIRQ